jgi:hypothetical protein
VPNIKQSGGKDTASAFNHFHSEHDSIIEIQGISGINLNIYAGPLSVSYYERRRYW